MPIEWRLIISFALVSDAALVQCRQHNAYINAISAPSVDI